LKKSGKNARGRAKKKKRKKSDEKPRSKGGGNTCSVLQAVPLTASSMSRTFIFFKKYGLSGSFE
jgi:hypothetical protein